MNVNQLHRELGRLIEQGHGRKPVCIDKRTFSHPLEQDGAVILDVASIDGPRFIEMCDGDGFQKWRADGSAAGRKTVVLIGAGNAE